MKNQKKISKPHRTDIDVSVFTANPIEWTESEGVVKYHCGICHRDFLDPVSAHAHVALRHPTAHRILTETLDRYTEWYFLVSGRANPVPKPRGGQGTKNAGNVVNWLPTIWSVVESKRGKPNETLISSYGSKNRGTLTDVGTTIIMLLTNEKESDIWRYPDRNCPGRFVSQRPNTLGTKYGRALGNSIF